MQFVFSWLGPSTVGPTVSGYPVLDFCTCIPRGERSALSTQRVQSPIFNRNRIKKWPQLPVLPMKCSILFDPTGTGSAAGRAELRSWDGLAAQLLHRSHYGGLPGALGCSTVPHWCGHVQRTFCNFPGRICPLSAHGSRHAVKHTLTDKTCPLGAKIQVQHDAQTAFGSVGATCASAHMMRSGAKTF